MLKLSFFLKSAAVPATSVVLTDLRVSGATLWNPLDRELLARYFEGAWKHRGRWYSTLAVTGGGCLLFGITRDPSIVSDPIDHFYFIGPTLSANGVAIARYIPQQDMWQGMVRPMWWNAMRIVSSEAVTAAVDQSQVVLLNPWQPHPMHSRPVFLGGQTAVAPNLDEPPPRPTVRLDGESWRRATTHGDQAPAAVAGATARGGH
jgi:hypothetical protein